MNGCTLLHAVNIPDPESMFSSQPGGYFLVEDIRVGSCTTRNGIQMWKQMWNTARWALLGVRCVLTQLLTRHPPSDPRQINHTTVVRAAVHALDIGWDLTNSDFVSLRQTLHLLRQLHPRVLFPLCSIELCAGTRNSSTERRLTCGLFPQRESKGTPAGAFA